MYNVYIRITQNRQFAYVRTSWMVNDKGLSDDKKDIIDPFVIQQTSILIEKFYNMLNQVDASTWSANEVLTYVTDYGKDLSFSDYARAHIEKLIKRGQERTSRNYKWSLQHMERFAGTDNIMFSRLTSAFLNRWIESLSTTTRSKEQYPVCMREVYKAARREFNDEERGILKLKNPWSNVAIPRSDVPEKRAIPASKLRAFFNVVPDRSKFTHPLMEVGQDVALISFCMCGLNAVDIFNAKKDQYDGNIFHYERQKTRSTRSDRGYFEVRVPAFLKPTFEKYLTKDERSPWLFNFHDRLATSDSFCANVNTGIKQIWEKVEPGYRASLYAFRHSWATIAQNECGATMNDVDFGLNHSINRMAKVYVKIDFTPAWILNEKVIDFVFFTDQESKYIEKENVRKKFSVSMQHYSFAVQAFVEMVRQFGMDKYEFAVHETKTYEVIEDVKNFKSEIGILYLNNFNSKVLTKLFTEFGLEFHRLLDCGIYAYMWKGNPLASRASVTMDDLQPYPCLAFEQGNNNSFYFAEEVLSTYEYKQLIRANDRATMLNLMKGLNGYTLCSGIICEE